MWNNLQEKTRGSLLGAVRDLWPDGRMESSGADSKVELNR